MKLYEEVRYATDEEWREARKGGVGGSDVAAIMGISKWKSPLEVWLEKTGRAESPDLSDNEAVEWGNRLEPMVADKFASLHPEMSVLRKNCTMVSNKRPWAFANIDRELRSKDGRGILEIKTAGARSADHWVFGVPDFYMTQVQHYLSVTGWDFAWVAVLIGGQEYREYYVPRDEADIRAIEGAVDMFWNGYVVPGVMPQMTGYGNEGSALAEMFSDKSDEYIPVLDADFPELGEAAEINREIKALQERKKELDNTIKAKIGNAKGIESESTRCTWVRSASTKFDAKRFDADNPGARDPYITTYAKDGGLRLSAAMG